MSLANARKMMIASRKVIETTVVVSTEQLKAARKQLGGERTRRGGASAAARARLEAATTDLDEAQAEATAASEVGNAISHMYMLYYVLPDLLPSSAPALDPPHRSVDNIRLHLIPTPDSNPTHPIVTRRIHSRSASPLTMMMTTCPQGEAVMGSSVQRPPSFASAPRVLRTMMMISSRRAAATGN